MYAVSARFLPAIPQPHQIASTLTYTVPGGTAQPLTLVSGSVQADSSAKIRRTANLVIDGGSALYDRVSTPGCRIRVQHGFVWSSTSRELVPVITGELSQAAQQLGDGTVQLTLADLWQKLDAETYLTAYSPAISATRAAEIARAVTTAVPGTTVTNTSADAAAGGTVGTTQTWSGSPGDLVAAYATDGGAEAFFGPDGNFIVRDVPLISNPPIWTVKPRRGGVITAQQRVRPLDKLYNTVVVTPSSLDGSQTWTQIVVQITDTTNPRHPSKIGVRPYQWQSPSIMTASEALAAGTTILNRLQGSSETLSLGAISNPALEAGDVLTATVLTDGADQTGPWLTTGFNLDLVTGGMTIDARAGSEVA